jgi:hypothetical protein
VISAVHIPIAEIESCILSYSESHLEINISEGRADSLHRSDSILRIKFRNGTKEHVFTHNAERVYEGIQCCVRNLTPELTVEIGGGM